MAHYRRWLDSRTLDWEDQRAGGFSRSSRVVLVLLIVTLLSAASMAHLELTSRATTISYRIRDMEEEKRELRSKKGQILFEIAQATHLATLTQRAREIGMVPAEDIEYLRVAAHSSTLPLAAPPAGTTGDQAEPAPARNRPREARGSAAPGWWKRLLDQFTAWSTVEPEVTPTRELEMRKEK